MVVAPPIKSAASAEETPDETLFVSSSSSPSSSSSCSCCCCCCRRCWCWCWFYLVFDPRIWCWGEDKIRWLIMAPKRELVLTAGDAGQGAAKRLRVAVPGGGSGLPAPASPGTRLLRLSVLVVLFGLRMSEGITVTGSISQLGRMVQKLLEIQTAIMSKFGSFQEQIGKLTGNMEGITHEVKNLQKQLACLHSNRHADQHPRPEANQERTAATGSNANIHLRFLNGLKTPVYTDKNITTESNEAIRIGIFEGDNMIIDGPLSKVKVEIQVLRGDFSNDGRVSWTEEEFNSHIAQGRDGQGFVLGGVCSVRLNNGEASFGRIRFKEGSCRTPDRKFIVGARVCMTEKIGVRVQEAVMKPVIVLDRRNEANEKRYPPKLDDEVYRLEEISKVGAYRKRLQEAQIFTVEEFLKAWNKDPHKLREVLQMKNLHKSWEKMVKHARDCCLKGRHELKAYHNEEANVVLFFNCVYDLVGAKFDGDYIAYNNFDPAKEAIANELKVHARDKLDSMPFNYVMNGDLPVPGPSSTNSVVGTSILVPAASQTDPTDHLVAPQGTAAIENSCHDRINHVNEPFYQNANFNSSSSIHDYQNTISPHPLHYQGEAIPPLGQQEPSTSSASLQQNAGPINSSRGTNVGDHCALIPQCDRDLPDWISEGEINLIYDSPSVHLLPVFPGMNLSQMQAPLWIGGASGGSTSAQHNLQPQQFLPQFQESMLGISYPLDLPNPVAEPSTWHEDCIPEPEPSTSAFPGSRLRKLLASKQSR